MTRIDPHSPVMWQNPEQHDIRKRHPCRGLPCRACYTFMWYLFCKVLKKWSRSPGWHRDRTSTMAVRIPKYPWASNPNGSDSWLACGRVQGFALNLMEIHQKIQEIRLFSIFEARQDSLPWSLPDSQAPRLPALLFHKWFHILLQNQRLADKLTHESWIEDIKQQTCSF